MRFDPFVGSNQKPNFQQRWARFVVNNPWLCIFLCLAWVAASAYGFKFAQFNADNRVLFSEEYEGLKRLEAVEAEFSKDDTLVILVRPHNGKIFTRENLTLLTELTEKAWTLPRTQRVDSLTNFQHTQVDGDDLNVVDLVTEPSQLSDEDIQQIRNIAINEPNIVKNVLSEKAHAAAVVVTVVTDDRSGKEASMIMQQAALIRQQMQEQYPNVDIMFSGMVAFNDATQVNTHHELTSTSMYSSLAILVCLFIMLRSLVSVMQTMFVVTCSIIIAAGSILLFGVELTAVMAGAPAIILTLAVADSIHILITYQQQIRSGAEKHQAMYESLRVNAQPVFLTSLTTAIGFLFLNSSKSPPFADMANMVSIGVMAAWLLSMVLLPSLVMILPQQKFRGGDHDHRIMNAFADFVIDHRVPVFVVSCIVFGGLASLSVKNEFNDVWTEYFDETIEVRKATDFMLKEVSGHHRLQFAFPSTGPSGIMEPEYMQGLALFTEWARQQQYVEYVSSFSDTIKRLNRDMNQGDPSYYEIPDQRDLISQYALMFQMSLPFGLGLENQINMDQSMVRVNVMLGGLSSNDIMAFEEKAHQWIKQNLPSYMHAHGIGFDLLLGELSHENGQGMLVGTALALVVVSLLLIFALGSLRYGLLSMLPNLFPAFISFGIWALIDGQIGISVSIVACMTLGIVIDNTVHFLSKYTRARYENNLSTVEATRYSFKTVGVALVATTLVISANFSMMALSHYYPNASMGLLTAITVAVALSVNFLFFVPVLIFIDGRQETIQKNERSKNSQTDHLLSSA